MVKSTRTQAGFTLIEMSIVLVIIGLVVGGVLVGQTLIRAAYVRAQISQIEKFNTADNTFYGKYQALPGDMNATTAQVVGFAARGPTPGQGDGNGIIQGHIGATGDSTIPNGEATAFWVDLSHAGLIEGGFAAGTPTATVPYGTSGTNLATWIPPAKLGSGNYVYAWSGGWQNYTGSPGDGINYFGLSAVRILNYLGSGFQSSDMGLSVATVYAIDVKVDDGRPQSGNVLAMQNGMNGWWASGGPSDPAGGGQTNSGAYDPSTYGAVVAGDGVATPPSAITCYDNAGIAGATELYSVGINSGAGLNCALSFKFQ